MACAATQNAEGRSTAHMAHILTAPHLRLRPQPCCSSRRSGRQGRAWATGRRVCGWWRHQCRRSERQWRGRGAPAAGPRPPVPNSKCHRMIPCLLLRAVECARFFACPPCAALLHCPSVSGTNNVLARPPPLAYVLFFLRFVTGGGPTQLECA